MTIYGMASLKQLTCEWRFLNCLKLFGYRQNINTKMFIKKDGNSSKGFFK
jgi:hypothetical protein